MNNDLISRSELLQQFENLKKKSETLRDVIYLEGVMAVIETAPTADTERRGEWIPDDYAYYHCSECGYEQDERECVSPYCPKCGAKMGDSEE